MESFIDAFSQAKDKLKVADYSLNKILQMSRDANVVRQAISNLHESQVRAVDAVLLHERRYKRVPAYPMGHLETKLRLFSQYCVKRYGLDEGVVKDIRLVNEWVLSVEGKPVSLSSDSRLVITDSGFHGSSIPLAQLKSMVVKTNSFIEGLAKVVQDARSD